MQENPTPESVAREFDRAEWLVLDLLLDDTPTAAGIWSLQEIAQVLGSELEAADALMGLEAAGLVHRIEKFAFASRAALRFHALSDCN
jgi:hypothetical protein